MILLLLSQLTKYIKMKKIISVIIEVAKDLGLNDFDINSSKSLLENREYGLAFDTIITQLYEYEIEIDNEFYELVIESAKKMKIPKEDYFFVKELVRAEGVVPKPVKVKIATILATLKAKD